MSLITIPEEELDALRKRNQELEVIVEAQLRQNKDLLEHYGELIEQSQEERDVYQGLTLHWTILNRQKLIQFHQTARQLALIKNEGEKVIQKIDKELNAAQQELNAALLEWKKFHEVYPKAVAIIAGKYNLKVTITGGKLNA